jgi:microcystin-dependent protein
MSPLNLGEIPTDTTLPAETPAPGTIMGWAAAAPPTDWLACDGSGKSTTTYAALYAVIGFAYGGSGSTFNLPDLRGRVPVGEDAGAGRLTANNVRGNASGAEMHTVSEAQMPNHSHVISLAANWYVYRNGIGNGAFPAFNGINVVNPVTDARGSGQAHPNMQPYQIINWIIKT